jgi:SAM-dependent methyltransferase
LRPELLVSGCDLSQRAITEAISYKDGVDYRVSDAARLPYEDNSFDAVMVFDVLEHVPDPASVINEIARVLKPGGIFHGFIPIEGQPHTFFWHLRNSQRLPIAGWKRDRIGHIQRFTDEGIIKLFADYDLRVIEKSYSFHLMGQILDIADYWQRDRVSRQNYPGWRKSLVKLTSRVIMFPTWRLAYYEDKFRAKSNRATGLHLTCIK